MTPGTKSSASKTAYLLKMVMFVLIIGCSFETSGRTDLVCFIFFFCHFIENLLACTVTSSEEHNILDLTAPTSLPSRETLLSRD